MYLEELGWHQFKQLNNIRKLPLNEQVQYYNRYLNDLSTQRIWAQIGAAAGGDTASTSLPSNCIEFVNNTSDGTQCRFWIETSAPTNYTITWGDGETTTGGTTVGTGGGVGIGDGEDKLEIDHNYADTFTEYTVRLCFDDISLVTYLEFNGDD
jgi:hypothetical protein